MGPKAGLPVLAAARLQRWAIMLSAYQHDIEFRPTHKYSNANCSSRLPLSTLASAEQNNAASLFNIHQIGTLPIGTDQLRRQTSLDPVLARVLHYTQSGWPASVEPKMKPFFNRRLEITIEAGCLMWGIKVIMLS